MYLLLDVAKKLLSTCTKVAYDTIIVKFGKLKCLFTILLPVICLCTLMIVNHEMRTLFVTFMKYVFSNRMQNVLVTESNLKYELPVTFAVSVLYWEARSICGI
jgi:hypothetical protein